MRLGARLTILAALAALAGCGEPVAVRAIAYADGGPWSEVRFLDGEAHGVWRTWWDNGNLKSEGTYAHGELHGEWRTWFEDGSPQTVQHFVLGRPDREWIHYYDDGQKASEGTYVDGLKDGVWREWYGDGTLKAEAEFEAGVEVGRAAVYAPDGRLETRTTYEDGEKVYMEVWNLDGDVWSRAEGPIENDRKNGVWTAYDLEGNVIEEHSGTYVDDELQEEDAETPDGG